MNGVSDQETVASSIAEEGLVAAVAGRRADVERGAALKELVRRRTPRMGEVLRQVIGDPAAPVELRTTAAVALGTEDIPQAQDALLAALESDQPALVGRAAESLGRIGDRAAWDAIARQAIPSSEWPFRAIRFARTLIAYRLGLDAERLTAPAPATLLEVDRQRAVTLEVTTVEPAAVRAAAPALKRVLPRIELDERGSLRFSCRRERLWIALTREVAGPAAGKRLAERSAVAAVVLKESTCPEGWHLYEYVLTHPGKARQAEVFGVRPSGEISHYGVAELRVAGLVVRLRAVDSPRVLPIELTVEYRGREGTLEIREAIAMMAPRAEQRRPAAPRPEGPRRS